VSVAELRAAYAATAQRWHDLRADARAANPVFDENAELAAALRCTDAGRAAIAELMAHDCSGVRVLAAAHSLDCEPARERAVAVLEELESGAGLHAIAAEHALAEFRAGRLEL
jgi:DNA-binding NarL/FixJ family response regulator